jgi:acetoacetyl-CoA synthetase
VRKAADDDSATLAPLIWQPSEERVAEAAMTAFAHHAKATAGFQGDPTDYFALHRWSIDDLPRFWRTLAEFYDVEFTERADTVLSDRRMPGAKWFPGARLSYAQHVFRNRRDDDVAIVSASELRPLSDLTWAELRDQSARLAAWLRARGVGPGDRVAAYLPNVPETVVAFLACASIGATWTSCSPDFGVRAVVDRIAQIEAKVLFAVDGYRYGGKDHDRSAVVDELRRALPTLEATVMLPYLGASEPPRDESTFGWNEVIATSPPVGLQFEQLPFEHPLWILYSSGTTGLPKGLVHSQGGILLEHLKWVGLQVDAGPGDRLLWMTTTGWTMWNFVVGGLLTGATIVLYDGSPTHPGPEVLWDLAADAGVTIFGAGASFYTGCRKSLVRPLQDRDLSRLRAIGSTGSPLPPEDFDWIYEQLGDVWLFSTSGGTDVCTAFVGGTPLLGVRRGELQAPALGVDVQAWDPSGRSLRGEVGELVVTQPMPSMPVALWNDPDGERYRASYFDTYPGVWRHGDWLELTASGGAVIHGRSDATINRGGIRIGSAEIYRVVLAMPEIEDAVVVDAPTGVGQSRILLFVRPSAGHGLDDDLAAAIRLQIRTQCSPRHVPDEVIEAPGIPRTLSGKVLETPIRRLLAGSDPAKVASRDALQNPQAFDWFVDFATRNRGEAHAASA